MLRDFDSGVAGESAARSAATTVLVSPRSRNFGGRSGSGIHSSVATEAGQAAQAVKSGPDLPGSHQFDGRVSGETHMRTAVDTTWAEDADVLGLLQPGSDSSSRKRGRASQATVTLTSMRPAPGSHTPSGSNVGRDEASVETQPVPGVPRPSKTRRSRKADGVGDAGQGSRDAHAKRAGIASHSSSRRKPGADPAGFLPTSTSVVPNPQHSEIGGNAGESPAARELTSPVVALGSQTNARRKASKARQAITVTVSKEKLPVAPNPSVIDDGSGVDRARFEDRTCSVDPALIAEIRMQWRMRQLWLSAETKLTLQSKAFCRALAVDGDKKEADVIYKAALGAGDHPRAALAMAAMLPLLESRDGIERRRGEIEKHLDRLAKQLPVAGFVKAVHGASLRSLAAIVGEAGDLAVYGNPGKLWKRMGLAPQDGKAYSTWRKDKGLTAEDWTAAGYSPRRRSVMFVIGSSLIGGMGNGKRPLFGQDLSETDWSPMQKLFVERLRYEAARDPAMGLPPTEAGKESYTLHARARARRYVEKRFLRDLWRAWRGEAATNCEASRADLPSLPYCMEAAE